MPSSTPATSPSTSSTPNAAAVDTSHTRRYLRALPGAAEMRELADRYARAAPFPHTALDDMVEPEALHDAIQSFPPADADHWTHYLHVNERKHANTALSTWPTPLRELAEELMAPPFVAFLEQLTGITGLLPDPSLDGGGLHRSEPGGYLNIHADYTKHHTHADWQRRVNVLLYLNEDWDESWGGQLELWDPEMRGRVTQISPRANRMAVFTTSHNSYHGHPTPLACPEGTARRSLALYYFTAGSQEKARTTQYRARPEDGWKRFLIALDGKVLRLYDIVKRRTGIGDAWVSKMLGAFHRSRRGSSNR